MSGIIPKGWSLRLLKQEKASWTATPLPPLPLRPRCDGTPHLWLLLLKHFVTVMRKVANTILENGTAIERGSPRDLENDGESEQCLRVVLIPAPIP